MGKKLFTILSKKSGRNSQGRVTVRHQGGRQKQFLREVDFKRDKHDIFARVAGIEYDPTRGAEIALLIYKDGEKRYILCPKGLAVGVQVISSKKAEIIVGNALPVKKIPVGTVIHCVELRPGKGGQLARGAGNGVIIQSKEKDWVTIKLPSSEERIISSSCWATIGRVGNVERKSRVFVKAGIKRHLGIRPTVRGVAQDPRSHPHGGGEGRSGKGMNPKSPWGKPTLGKRTRARKKYSDRWIIKRKRQNVKKQ